MPVTIPIVVKNLKSVQDLVSALDSVASSLKKGADGEKDLQKVNQRLKEMGAAVEVTRKNIEPLRQQLNAMVAAMKAVNSLKAPFTEIAKSSGSAVVNVGKLNKELGKTNSLVSTQLGNKAFMTMVRNSKASLKAQEVLNKEIEKQAELQMQIAMMDSRRINPNTKTGAALLETIKNTKTAKKLTAELAVEVERLTAAEKGRASLKQGAYAANIRKEQEAIAALDSQRKAAYATMEKEAQVRAKLKQGAYAAEIKKEQEAIAALGAQRKAAYAAMEKEAQVRAKLKEGAYVAQIRKEQEAIAALDAQRKAAYASMEKEAQARSKLKQGAYAANIRKEEQAYNSQVAALDKLKSRLMEVKGAKGSTSQVANLRKQVMLLNAELQRTGSVSGFKGSIANIGKQLTGIEKNFRNSTTAAKGWGTNMKYAMGGVARSMGAMTYSYAALAPLLTGIAIGSAVKKVYELGTAFEYATTYIEALSDGVNSLDASNIQSMILGMEGLRRGPGEMAMGMKEFAKAGVEAAESITQIEEMTKFATIAEIELGDAVKLVIGQTQAFGFGSNFSKTANVISAAALSSATDIQELATALSYTTELATVSGVQFEEVATAMAVMANAGIRGSKAGTAIRTSILKMQNPTQKLKGMLDDLGISWSAFTEEGQVKDMKSMFTELKRVTENLPDAQRVAILKELFGLRALKGGANLLRAQGQEWDQLYAKITQAGEALDYIDGVYDRLEDTSRAALERVQAAYETELVKAFDGDSVTSTLKLVESFLQSEVLSTFVSEALGVVTVIGDIAEAMNVVIDRLEKLKFPDVPDSWIKALEVFKEGAIKAVSTAGNAVANNVRAVKAVTDLVSAYGELKTIEEAVLKIQEDFGKVELPDNLEPKTVDEYERLKEVLSDTGSLAKMSAEEVNKLGKQVQSLISSVSSAKQKQVDVSSFDPAIKKLKEQIKEANEKGETAVYFKMDLDIAEASKQLELLEKKFNESSKKIDKFGSDAVGHMMKKEVLKLQAALKQLKYDYTPEGMLENAEKALGKELVLGEALEEMDEYSQKLQTIENQLLRMASNPEMNIDVTTDEGKESIERLRDALRKKLIGELKNSKSAVDNLKGAFLELEEKARKAVETAKLDPGTAEGEAYFKAIISGSDIFTKAIKDAQTEVRKLQDEIFDLKFDMDSSIAEERAKLYGQNMDVTRLMGADTVASLGDAIREASLAGGEGFNKQIELLKNALGIAEELGVTLGDDAYGNLLNIEQLLAKAASEVGTDISDTAIQAKLNQAKEQLKELSRVAQQELSQAAEYGYLADPKAMQFDKQLSQIKQLEKAAAEAATSGEEGWQRQLELLQKAFGIAKSMDASKDIDVLRARMERAKIVMNQFAGALNSMAYESKEDYLQAKKAYEAAQRGDVDKNMQNRKIKEMEAIEAKILEVKQTRKDAAQEELADIQKFAKETLDAWGLAKDATDKATAAVNDYGDAIKGSGHKMNTWKDGTVSNLKEAEAAAMSLINTMNQIPPVPEISGGGGGGSPEGYRMGGAVVGGMPITVGEAGREVFVPGSDGFIIPNHDLRYGNGKSKDVMTVNLMIGGENITLEGDRSEVEKFQRAEQFNQKFASR